MAILFEQNESTVVLHRMHFWGRQSGLNTVSWSYKGQRYLVERPADGSPARRWSTQCPVCGKTLNYAVHSVAATRRRRIRRWVGMWVSLVGGVSAFILMFSLIGTSFDGTYLLGVFAIAGLLGIGAIFPLGEIAAGEIGFVGHGASLPIISLHQVRLTSMDDLDYPQ